MKRCTSHIRMDQKRVRNDLETRLECQKRNRNEAETRSSWMDQIKPWMYAFEARVAVDPNRTVDSLGRGQTVYKSIAIWNPWTGLWKSRIRGSRFDEHRPFHSLSSNKKFKNNVKPNKASHFALTNTLSTPSAINRPIITPAKLLKRKAEVPSTPVVPDRAAQSRPSSAPTVTGRSSKSKRIGILSRRRVSSSPFTRVDPPAFSNVPTLEKSIPKTWIFDIREDTEGEEASNLMYHYTLILDIESRAAAKDDRGKENVPPVDGLALCPMMVRPTLNIAYNHHH